jgi:hypothetical protein
MAINIANFQALFHQLMKIKLFGSAPPPVPFGKKPTAAQLSKLVGPGTLALPKVFQNAYANPLQQNLGTVLSRLRDQNGNLDLGTLEAVTGAVYQHSQTKNKAELHRFLAVISDLYRSFLSSKRRAAANFPLQEETLPPLAMFQHNGDSGPFTIPVDDMNNLFAAGLGVVSLPAVYRDHPVLWTSLSHETGGHDVIHADVDLMPEMQAGVIKLLGGPTTIGNPSSLSQPQLLARRG